MPLLKKPENEAPEGAFLAVRQGDMDWLAIMPGSLLAIVEDANNSNKRFPLVLKSVRRDRIVFTLQDTEYVYRLMEGKPLTAAAAQRIAKNRAGKKA
ncbi:MAG: hypothetical protein ACRC1H_11400 [Caldilineaceae bacterium]